LSSQSCSWTPAQPTHQNPLSILLVIFTDSATIMG
jgi:hypothetical protein